MSTMFPQLQVSPLAPATPDSLGLAGISAMPFQVGTAPSVDLLSSVMQAQQPTVISQLPQVQATHAVPLQVQTPSNPQLAQVALNQGYTGNSADSLPAMVELATMIGAKPTPNVINALMDWHQAEGGNAAFNPFNTTQSAPGSTPYNGVGVQNFVSPLQGLTATANTLENGQYGNLLSALRNGDSTGQIAQAIAQSPWGTGNLVQQVAAGNYSQVSPQQVAQAVSSLGGGVSPSSLGTTSSAPSTAATLASMNQTTPVIQSAPTSPTTTSLPPQLQLASTLFGNNPILNFALQRMVAVRAQQQQPAGTSSTPSAPAGSPATIIGSTLPPVPRAGTVNPYAPGVTHGRVDQGVDYIQNQPYRAPASGEIVKIDPNWYQGTPNIYEKLNHPITVNGHTYDAVYFGETSTLPGEHVGEKITAGQPIAGGSKPGSGLGEQGFASDKPGLGWIQSAYGTFNGSTPTQPGLDFQAFIRGIGRKR